MARNKYPEVTVGRILDVSAQLFIQKGYEHTTIQDIINALGDLSKGAIYHHFKSKEDIIDAVAERINSSISEACLEIKNDSKLKGLEKLKKLIITSLQNPSQKELAQMMPNLLKNPKLLAKEMELTINFVAHHIIEDFIKEGIADGSIKTEYPRELAEVISLLANIWINPFVFPCTPDEMQRKCTYYKVITDSLGAPIFDDTIIKMTTQLLESYHRKNIQP